MYHQILNLEYLKKFNIVDFGVTSNSIPITFKYFDKWVSEKKHLPLIYLGDHRKEIRTDLKKYFPEFKTAIVFLFSYHQTKMVLDQLYKNKKFKVASYTLGFEGEDYHLKIRRDLEEISHELLKINKNMKFKIGLDIHPILDRDLAYKSGLGFYGKNSMLISKKHGSFFIIASLLIDQDIEFINKEIDIDHCGQCTKCIDNCPTSAIDINTRTIIAKDCISTFTIEEFKFETVASEKMNLDSGYIFGCDICQNVCPWNERIERQNKDLKTDLSERNVTLLNFFEAERADQLIDKLEKFSNSDFKSFFKETSFFRSGKRGLLKNILFYKNKN